MSTVILTYHRVDTDFSDPYLLAVEPARFANHLSVIGRVAEPVDLHGALGRSRRPRVVVTLDDGYADNVAEALPLLEAAGVPATVFVVSTMVGARREFWHHRLDRCLQEAPAALRHLEVDICGCRITLDIGNEKGRHRALWALHARMRPLAPARIEEILEAIALDLGTSGTWEQRRALDRDELRQLAASRITTVGAHTRRHAWLSSLGYAEQEREIVGSREELEELAGTTVDTFAYPYGLADSYDRHSVRILRRSGFTVACTTHNEPITRLTSRYRLPRKSVRNWDEQSFESQLRKWLEE